MLPLHLLHPAPPAAAACWSASCSAAQAPAPLLRQLPPHAAAQASQAVRHGHFTRASGTCELASPVHADGPVIISNLMRCISSTGAGALCLTAGAVSATVCIACWWEEQRLAAADCRPCPWLLVVPSVVPSGRRLRRSGKRRRSQRIPRCSSGGMHLLGICQQYCHGIRLLLCLLFCL